MVEVMLFVMSQTKLIGKLKGGLVFPLLVILIISSS